MEAIIVVIAAIVAVLLQRLRSVNEQLDQAHIRVATGERKVDELKSQIMAATERIGLETRRSSELKEELTAAREVLVAANNQNDVLAEQLQEEKRFSKSESQQNAELVTQLKAARREIRELRKVIAGQDEKSRLSQADHSELSEQNVKLKKQLNDALYALSKETSLRTKVTADRRRYHRRVEAESQTRSEVEEQLRSALLEVQRLSKDLRKLKSDHTKQVRAKRSDLQRVAALEAALSETQLELQHEQAQKVGIVSRLQESYRDVKRISELENLNAVLERKYESQRKKALNAEVRRNAVEMQIKLYVKDSIPA
ncbi:MAG: hypothetical protein OXI77_07015 [Chloroflexota bacterium]|nr:hypothetical protein [Chloroflexota bacterium]MDE2910265.1 hypothetical protein [Chloroflexota bacterium]